MCFIKASILYDTKQYKTKQYSTIQYNTIQYNTIQYNTMQHNTIQYNQYQSINQNLYSAPLRSLLRGASPYPGQAEKNSLDKVVELRTCTVWEVLYVCDRVE